VKAYSIIFMYVKQYLIWGFGLAATALVAQKVAESSARIPGLNFFSARGGRNLRFCYAVVVL